MKKDINVLSILVSEPLKYGKNNFSVKMPFFVIYPFIKFIFFSNVLSKNILT